MKWKVHVIDRIPCVFRYRFRYINSVRPFGIVSGWRKICGEGEGGNQCPSLATLFNSAYPFISDVGIAKGRDGCIAIHERCQMS